MLGIRAATTQTVLLLVWFFGCAVMGATLELAFLAAFLVAAKNPDLRPFAESAANFVVDVAALVIRGHALWRDG